MICYTQVDSDYKVFPLRKKHERNFIVQSDK